jgi:ketosteroid isomerase-like protein
MIAEDIQTARTRETIDRFNEAFNRHDIDAVMALMTGDVVFENTSPAPDGTRYAGQPAVRAFWVEFFANSPRAHFETEAIVVAGDRATVCWRYDWGAGHTRGIDLFRVQDGKVAEKFSYVKG